MERSATEKLWLLGSGALALVLLLIGYFFFISPQRSRTSDVNEQIASAQIANLALQGKINSLNAQNKKLASYEQQLHVAQLALPTSSGMPAFLRALQSLSSQSATSLTNLTVGAPTDLDGGQIAAAAPVNPASSSSAPAPGTTSSAASAPSGIYAIPITATVSGAQPHLMAFLTSLQSVQPRAVLVTNVKLNATGAATNTNGQQAASPSLDLTMQAFVAPETGSTTPAAAPAPSPSASSSEGS